MDFIISFIKVFYIFSVIVFLFIINYSTELDSAFFVFGGSSDYASNAIVGNFDLFFVSSLVGLSIFVFISSFLLIKTKNIKFLLTLIAINIFFSFDAIVGVLTSKQQRVFDGYTFNEAIDNSIKATHSDGILHYSISDLSMIAIFIMLSFAMLYKKILMK